MEETDGRTDGRTLGRYTAAALQSTRTASTNAHEPRALQGERERAGFPHSDNTLTSTTHSRNTKLAGLPERHLAHQSWPPIHQSLLETTVAYIYCALNSQIAIKMPSSILQIPEYENRVENL